MGSLQVSAAEARVIVICGIGGTGKSTRMWDLGEEELATGRYANCVVFDPMVCAPELADVCAPKKIRLAYHEWDDDKEIPVPPLPMGPPGYTSGQKYDWTHTLYLVDEVDLLCSPQSIHKPLRKLLNYRRHWGSTMIVNFRRLASVHKDVEGLATDIYVGQLVARRDLDALSGFLDGRFNEDGQPYDPGRVAKLEPYKFEHYRLQVFRKGGAENRQIETRERTESHED